jgi:hypothetical protein
MFHEAELERLQKQKALLVLQSEANRQKLKADWHRLSSAAYWLDSARGGIQRHPGVATGLAAAGGMLAMRFLRAPGGIVGTLKKVGGLASTAMAVWRFLRKDKSS